MPITDYIASLLLCFCNLECHEQVKRYRYFYVIPVAEGMSGILFEAYCQKYFK